MKAGNEARVGVVLLAALVLAIGTYFFLRGWGMNAQEYYLQLDKAAIISQGNDVRLQGVKVGVVKSVALDPDTQQPLVTLAIRKSEPRYSLYKSYSYSVKTNGILGENYVDIQGNPKTGDIAYEPNDFSVHIPTKSTAGLFDVGDKTDEIIKDLRITLTKFNETLDNLNHGVLSTDNQVKFAKALEGVTLLTNQVAKSFGPGGVKVGFGDPDTQRYLNNTLLSAASAAGEAGLAARDVRRLTVAAGAMIDRTGGLVNQSNAVLRENRAQLKHLLANLDKTTGNAADTIESVNFLVKNGNLDTTIKNAGASIERAAKNFEDTTAAFKSMSNEDTQKELRATISAMRESTEALRDTAKSINGFIADPGNQNQLKSTLSTLNTTATTLAETTANLKDATAGLKNVMGDPKVQDDMKAIPSELRKTLESTSATADRINALLGGRRHKKDGDGDGKSDGKKGERTSSLLDDMSFTYRHLTNGEHGRNNFGDLRFQTDLFDMPIRLGVDNIGEGSDFTLQGGQYLSDKLALRYGLYRSKLGVGAEYATKRFSLETNLYDPNDRSWNVYGGLKVTPQVEVLVGREKQGDVRSNAIGVRLRR